MSATPGADPAVARALAARVGDDLAVAAAGRARAQRAHLAEERALHLLHLAPAVAGLAGAPAASPGAAPEPSQVVHSTAVSTLSSRVSAERRLGELDVEPHQGVLAAPRARPRTAARPPAAGRRRTRP